MCRNINKCDISLSKLLWFKWEADENKSNFNEVNYVIEELYLEICCICDKIVTISAGCLTEKSKENFLEVMFYNLNEQLLITFSQIKKCNTTGRSLMLKDIKFLKQRIQEAFGLKKLNNIFSSLEMYINAWYFVEEEMVKYVKKENISPKALSGLLNTADNFNLKKGGVQKKDFIKIFETQVYLDILELFKMSYYN